MTAPQLVLGSTSPRRLQLLQAAGWQVVVQPPHVDDGQLDPRGADPSHWTMALAWLKARSVAGVFETEPSMPIVTADTVCVIDGRVIGQPADVEDARAMLIAMRNRAHRVLTGLCVLWRGQRHLTVDESTVHFGALSDQACESYLQTDLWRGKAGAYNLGDRVKAGWPLQCDGDPTTVMGMPMMKLTEVLQDCGVECPQ